MAEETKKKPGGNKNSGKQPYLYTNPNFKKLSKTAKNEENPRKSRVFRLAFLSTRVEMLDKKRYQLRNYHFYTFRKENVAAHHYPDISTH